MSRGPVDPESPRRPRPGPKRPRPPETEEATEEATTWQPNAKAGKSSSARSRSGLPVDREPMPRANAVGADPLRPGRQRPALAVLPPARGVPRRGRGHPEGPREPGDPVQ